MMNKHQTITYFNAICVGYWRIASRRYQNGHLRRDLQNCGNLRLQLTICYENVHIEAGDGVPENRTEASAQEFLPRYKHVIIKADPSTKC